MIPLGLSATEEYDGSSWTSGGSLEYSKIWFRKFWCSNSSISFMLVMLLQETQVQQKNMMEQVGQVEELLLQQVQDLMVLVQEL
jgi:hypothetical protein